MLVERIISVLPIKSKFLKLLIGSTATALMISLGMVYILEIYNLSIDPVLPSAFAAVGASVFAARFYTNKF